MIILHIDKLRGLTNPELGYTQIWINLITNHVQAGSNWTISCIIVWSIVVSQIHGYCHWPVCWWLNHDLSIFHGIFVSRLWIWLLLSPLANACRLLYFFIQNFSILVHVILSFVDSNVFFFVYKITLWVVIGFLPLFRAGYYTFSVFNLWLFHSTLVSNECNISEFKQLSFHIIKDIGTLNK